MQIRFAMFFGVLGWLPCAQGHGRLLKPPSRSSMWRDNIPGAVRNYQDNELYCGGFQNQVAQGYRCGLCGDPWQAPVPRDNERGGKYGRGPLVQEYKRGDVIDVEVQITANHKGWMEFRICPTNNPQTRATQECLQLLAGAGSSSTRFYLPEGTGIFQYRLQLPPELTCVWCVLQWRYHTGNSWGTDPDGRACVGCGFQEEFYGCADVAVLSQRGQSASSLTPAPTPSPTPTLIPSSTPAPTPSPTPTLIPSSTPVPTPSPTPILIPSSTPILIPSSTPSPTFSPSLAPTPLPTQTQAPPSAASLSSASLQTSFPSPSPSQSPTPTPSPSSSPSPSTPASSTSASTSTIQTSGGGACRPSRAYQDTPNMNKWCKENCAKGHCPESHCVCGAATNPKCRPVAVWSAVAGMQGWCETNCGQGHCPPNMCYCTV